MLTLLSRFSQLPTIPSVFSVGISFVFFLPAEASRVGGCGSGFLLLQSWKDEFKRPVIFSSDVNKELRLTQVALNIPVVERSYFSFSERLCGDISCPVRIGGNKISMSFLHQYRVRQAIVALAVRGKPLCQH